MTSSPSQVLGRTQAELRALWAAPPAAGHTPKARACTTNLVVVAASPAIAERWVAIVDEVVLGLPARAIVVGLDREAPDGLDASTSAVCAPSGNGEQTICSERIFMTARGGVCSRVASCIGTLCATDVPTTLVWPRGLTAEDPIFAALALEADRVVFDGDVETDTGELGGVAHLLALLAAVLKSSGARGLTSGPAIADLAWTRLGPWQEYCARMFDGPLRPALATKITRVELAQAGSPGSPLGSEAALLLGWLATRLGWNAGAPAATLRATRPDGGSVDIALRADPLAKARQGALLSVRIDAGGSELALRGQIAREMGEPDAAIWHLDMTARDETQRIEQHVRLRGSGTARLLERTLHRPPRDNALAESVAWVASQGVEGLACA